MVALPLDPLDGGFSIYSATGRIGRSPSASAYLSRAAMGINWEAERHKVETEK
jgi:hypothetical protein